MKMAAPAKNVDDYLVSVPATARATLKKIRRTIKEAAPNATEKISYGMPSFYYLGQLVAYAAFKDHCSFFPMSPAVMRDFAAELKGYSMSKGTIRFPADKPLHAALVRRIVKARIAENQARQALRGRR